MATSVSCLHKLSEQGTQMLQVCDTLRAQMKAALERLQEVFAAFFWNRQQRLFWLECCQTLEAVMWVPHHQMNLVPFFTKKHRFSSVYICLCFFLLWWITFETLTNKTFSSCLDFQHLKHFMPALKYFFIPTVCYSELYAFKFLIIGYKYRTIFNSIYCSNPLKENSSKTSLRNHSSCHVFIGKIF